MRRRNALMASLLLSAACGRRPPPSPQDMVSFRVYNLRTSRGEAHTEKALATATCVDLNVAVISGMLSRATYHDSTFWLSKGEVLAMWQTNDGGRHPVGISYYGGVIEVLDAQGYFVFADTDRTAWDEIVMKGVLERTFGPINAAARHANELARLPEYIQDLKAGRRLIRATDGIGGLGPEAATAVPFLIPLIGHPEPNTRHNAIWALGRIGPAAVAALPDLKAALPKLAAGTHQEATNSIRLISGQGAVTACPETP